MKLSTKGRYAVMAMVDVACQSNGKPVSLADIAVRQEISQSYLEQLFGKLRKGGLVKSVRGPGGGYVLARPADAVSFADVIRVIDGPLALAPCVSQTAFRKCDDCPDLETCSLRPALRMARDATAAVLESYSLQHAVDDSGGERTAAVIGLTP